MIKPMSELLIIKNITREGPGLLEGVLKDEGVIFDVVDLDKSDALPKLNDYKALVVLGGPDSANDETDKMTTELAYIRQALAAHKPYLGICLGLQTLVKAAGGNVVKGAKEVGFIDQDGNQHTVQVTDEAEDDPLLAGLPKELDVFQLHGETVELAPDMTLLASGKFCQNQIIKVADRAYGIQSHFELTPEMLSIWAAQDPDLVPIGNTKLQADFAAIEQSYKNIGETLLKNFLRIAGLTVK
jgi:GMP synthase-like glutamine amidotransferase